MNRYKLYIGNKNYSSWSMRPWLVMKYFGLPFTEEKVRFDSFTVDSVFKQTILPLNPYGTVPVLTDGDLNITDSLAICEYLAENHPELRLWPDEKQAKVQARNLTANMHNGYPHLRQYLPMNIETVLIEVGQIILRDQPKVKTEIDFLDNILSFWLNQSKGSYLFGDFTIVDAFYAPVCLRLKNYAIPTSATVTQYIDTICQNHAVAEWTADAMAEKDFVVWDEPYRISR